MKRGTQNHIVIPRRTPRRFYGHGIPKVDLERLAGRLIVVEGADGSGRSTQIAMLVQWLEGSGHATTQVGLKRSSLVSEELEQAQQGNILSRTTLSLFYATDFADQLRTLFSRHKAGFIVLAGRIYTSWPETWCAVRMSPGSRIFTASHWAGPFLFECAPRSSQRSFPKIPPDYWESGMDLGLSRDMFDSFEAIPTCNRLSGTQATYGCDRGRQPSARAIVPNCLKISAILAGK
jgi:dTMP kinase